LRTPRVNPTHPVDDVAILGFQAAAPASEVVLQSFFCDGKIEWAGGAHRYSIARFFHGDAIGRTAPRASDAPGVNESLAGGTDLGHKAYGIVVVHR
jgi:hypothetical protein